MGNLRISLLNSSARVLIGRCSIVETDAEVEALYRFRYRIYIEELGKRLPTADHASKRLPDPDDSGAIHLIVGRRTTQPVACVRLHLGEKMPQRALEDMRVADAVRQDGHRGGFVSKLMVERSLRGRGAAMLLMVNMAVEGARSGGHYALFHCAQKLAPLYERYGFQRIGVPFETEYTGTQVPMISIYGDYSHYRLIGSPLAPYLKAYQLSSSRIKELKQLFGLPEEDGAVSIQAEPAASLSALQ